MTYVPASVRVPQVKGPEAMDRTDGRAALTPAGSGAIASGGRHDERRRVASGSHPAQVKSVRTGALLPHSDVPPRAVACVLCSARLECSPAGLTASVVSTRHGGPDTALAPGTGTVRTAAAAGGEEDEAWH